LFLRLQPFIALVSDSDLPSGVNDPFPYIVRMGVFCEKVPAMECPTQLGTID
jgi:hypothetical protein